MIIIFLSDIAWYGLHQRPQHIVLALAKRWPVLWVEPAVLTRRASFTPKLVQPNIYTMSFPVIPYNARSPLIQVVAKFLSRFPLARGIVHVWQRSVLRKALSSLEINDPDRVFILHNFHVIDLVDEFHPSVVVYDYIDNAFGFTRLPKHIIEAWKKTIKQADIIIVTSPTLAKQIESIRSDNIHYVGNGVEFDHFAKAGIVQSPLDLPTGKPIVGYIGAVYPWLDYDLIKRACTELPAIDFVFIGPVHPQVRDVVRELGRLPNVKFLGFKPYKDIPHYLHRFSVGIIPFKKNELTASVNPVKLYEYSAAGKPTVSTDFSDDLCEFKDLIFIARSQDDFLSSITTAIQRSRESRFMESLVTFARTHDWKNKTSVIVDFIQRYRTHS
ncbi:MAG: glycosyltransferase [Ignavibacteriae bacterium]|nr:glycosyltransferase [Ignavibacteria bacterium]MBI3365756.1 glycosyltransferase [Ignavibacteriota bacterium]